MIAQAATFDLHNTQSTVKGLGGTCVPKGPVGRETDSSETVVDGVQAVLIPALDSHSPSAGPRYGMIAGLIESNGDT